MSDVDTEVMLSVSMRLATALRSTAVTKQLSGLERGQHVAVHSEGTRREEGE